MEEKVYIEMEEVIDAIRYRVCQGNGNEEHTCKRGSCAYCGIMEIMSDISSIPAVDVQPVKHGRWINKGDYSTCTVCGGSSGTQYDGVEPIPKLTPYCPNCGARMDFKEENNYAK